MRLYWPAELRPAFDALMAIDAALGEVVAGSSQPALGAIRLAWWRDALERLDHAPAPAEPRLSAVARDLLPLGVTGADLAALEAGWATLLDEAPEQAPIEERGARLFAIAARWLGVADAKLGAAGSLFALGQVQRMRLFEGNPAALQIALASHRFARGLRPLTALARLAARDLAATTLEPEATPGRAAALLRHRLSGRVA